MTEETNKTADHLVPYVFWSTLTGNHQKQIDGQNSRQLFTQIQAQEVINSLRLSDVYMHQ